MPVVVLTGMRQTGKSTFLRLDEAAQGRKYVTFDDFSTLAAATGDPDRFLESDLPLTIDEAQKCPEILLAIKRRVDQDRKNGWFLLSGSANFAMLPHVSESLAGRAVYLTMHPFSRRELSPKCSEIPYLRRFLDDGHPPGSGPVSPISPTEALTGGMPSVCLGEAEDPRFWFRGYEQTYLERDIRQLSQVGDLLSFRNLMHLAALRTGGILNITELGREARLKAATAGRYLSVMEGGFLVHRLPPFLKSRAARLVKSPKLYFSDSGLAAFLAGVIDMGTDPLWGALWETYGAQNLASILAAHLPDAGLYFWCVQGRHEVDFVAAEGSKCLALEWKSTQRWDGKDLAGLRAFLASTPQCVGAILVHNGTETVQLGEKLWAAPAAAVIS